MRVGDPFGTLQGKGDFELVSMHAAMTGVKRNGRSDWSRILDQLTPEQQEILQQHVQDAKERQEKEYNDRVEKRKADQLKAIEDGTVAYRKAARHTAGVLQSDVHEAITWHERTGLDDGDWVDDPVAACISGRAWAGEEVAKATGVKLQITLSLDMSNSMWHNGIMEQAMQAYTTLGLALEQLAAANQGSVFTEQFLFALHEGGKYAATLKAEGYSSVAAEHNMGKFERTRTAGDYPPSDAGDDTWVAPLFAAIEKWEQQHSDQNAVRLDLVITDGVLEHKVDIKDASMLQERRDGSLQAVFLNFLPEAEWRESLLPRRCVQYPVQGDNVNGLLRTLVQQFASVQV
jgi:hypothetical protein